MENSELTISFRKTDTPRADFKKTGADRESLLAGFTANARLPRPPALVLQVLEKASQPDCLMAELADIVCQDPGLCGRLLQTVNSAIFGLRYPAASIDQALKLLGTKQVRSLVLSLSLPDIHEQISPDRGMTEYWRYSVTVAIVARELATLQGRAAPADDLVAGLLCDVGTIILRQVNPAGADQLAGNGLELLAKRQCELEEEILGINHAELGAYLLQSWRLPAEITESIRCHHQPALLAAGAGEIADRAFLLFFASQIANVQAGADSPEACQAVLDLARTCLGMDESQLVGFLEPINEKVEAFSRLLKVKVGTCGSYASIFAAATQELVRLSIENSAAGFRAGKEPVQTALWRLLDTSESKSKSLPSTDTSNTIAGPDQSQQGKVPADLSSHDSLKGDEVISLGQYKVIEVLGQGGMGVVFRGFDTGLRRHVAIKVLRPEFASNSQYRRRFAREAQLAASVIHENVVTVYAVEESADFAYLVMEYVDGMSLQDKLDPHGGLPAREIVEIGIQIAEGLAAAHVRGLIHRDIKPANVLLNKTSMQAKLADFGLARPVDDSSLTQQGAMVGTPAYMAPEQVRQETLDARTDLFSLGGVFYAMCCGEPPFGIEQTFKVLKRICDEDPPSLRISKARIPNDLIGVIEKLLAKKPADRFQSAGEVAKQLRRQLLFMA